MAIGQKLNATLRNFIEGCELFFVGTAAPEGRVNVSPKGLDTLRILSDTRVVWLNLSGSGNETAAHLREADRMTLMFCAFKGEARILRVYGRAWCCIRATRVSRIWPQCSARWQARGKFSIWTSTWYKPPAGPACRSCASNASAERRSWCPSTLKWGRMASRPIGGARTAKASTASRPGSCREFGRSKVSTNRHAVDQQALPHLDPGGIETLLSDC